MKKKNIFDLQRASVEEFHSRRHRPVAVVLDNIRSLNNIGSIFRTADGFGLAEVVLCGISACPPSPEIHKTALGAEESMTWRYYATTMAAVRALRREGYRILVLEQVHGSVSLPDFRVLPGEKYALIAGNEVDGVDPEVVNAADVCIEIPQEGTKHSLNVAVSTAIALYSLTVGQH